jgi:hypothetical protein
MNISPLKQEALKTIKYLRDSNLLTDADALNIELIKALCDEWPEATTSTQRAALSKEIRACLEALPKPDVKPTDELADFLADMAETE